MDNVWSCFQLMIPEALHGDFCIGMRNPDIVPDSFGECISYGMQVAWIAKKVQDLIDHGAGYDDTEIRRLIAEATRIANEAKATAEGIADTANSALTKANEAKTTAEAIAGTAATALTTATEAESIASTAEAKADEAKATAEAVSGTAATALTKANEAKATADDAKTTAESVSGTAATALTTANEANAAATSANTLAGRAIETAGEAGNTARNAATTAQQALDGLDDKANTFTATGPLKYENDEIRLEYGDGLTVDAQGRLALNLEQAEGSDF